MRHLLGLPQALVHASARLLVLALSVTALGPVLHDVHVDECDPLVVWHDATQHALVAPGRDSDEAATHGHCVVCHLARTSRGAMSWEPSGFHVLAPGRVLLHADSAVATAPSAVPLPARAPPGQG